MFLRALAELMLVGLASLVYLGVRAVTGGDTGRAVGNADLLVRLERAVGLFRESALQDLFLRDEGIARISSWVYIWGFWPVIGSVALWLFIRHRATYYAFRNAFPVSGAVGLLCFALFPVAPPRLMSLGFVDTVSIHTEAYRVLQPPVLVNQYAAMPSFHFGWLVLMGVALNRESRNRLVRLFGWLMPIAMAWAIVVTGNHYFVDAVAGALISLIGLALVEHRPLRHTLPGCVRHQPHSLRPT